LFKQEDELPIEEPSALNDDAKKHFLHRTIAGQHLDRPAAPRAKRRQANAASNGGAFGESSRHLRPNAIVAAGGPAPIHRRSEENSGNRPLLLQTVDYLEKCSLSKKRQSVESSLAILPIIVRLPLVLQRTSAAGTIYRSQM